MVSDFVTGEGRLKVRDEIRDEELMKEGIQRDAAVYFEYGGKNEGYWKGEDMVRQVLDVAVKAFENSTALGVKGVGCLTIRQPWCLYRGCVWQGR
jgi:hypothetical protein